MIDDISKDLVTYLMPAGFGEAEFTEKRSRFIGRVWPVLNETEALEHIRDMRSQHSDAKHNVYAYIIRENNITRYSDDGEPSGTSGMPTLNVFAQEDITNICCVVTRYFGGTLLGTGGLVRAYSRAAKLALEQAGLNQMAQWQKLTVACDYGFYERVRRFSEEFEAVVENTDFGTDVMLELQVRCDKISDFENKLIDASGGRVLLTRGVSSFFGVRIR